MNLRQTAEMAALVATSAAHIIDSPDPVPTESLHGYWKQSRTRLKCWFAGLQVAQVGSERDRLLSLPQQTQLVTLSREILVSEMLTRIWSTVLLAADQRQEFDHGRKAAENIFQGHLEARHQVLRLLADDVLPPNEQISLDRFRRRVERWTDALLGPLLGRYGIDDFAFEPARAQEFAESSLQNDLRGAAEITGQLLVASVAAAFPKTSAANQERAVLNLAIVRSILAAFPKPAFSSDGRLKSSAHGRLERSSRHRESPVLTDPDSTDNTDRPRLPGLSFLDLRRREREAE